MGAPSFQLIQGDWRFVCNRRAYSLPLPGSRPLVQSPTRLFLQRIFIYAFFKMKVYSPLASLDSISWLPVCLANA